MKKKIAYCIPGLYYPGGMERVLTLKANYLAEQNEKYEIWIILTEGKNQKNYYSLSPKVRLVHLDINFDELNTASPWAKITGYLHKQRLFKQRLTACLTELKPDITVSLLRRDINFINSIQDGSIKVGELHFNKTNYRKFTNPRFPLFFRKAVSHYWMNQLIRQLRKLRQLIVLTEEDKTQWTELHNVSVIPNPLPFYPETISSCENKQVIAVGRYMPEKGFDLLIDAWQFVAARHPGWQLCIYGEGHRAPLEQRIATLGLQNSCLLQHAVDNIIDKYCESSIFVLSSRQEGFGMVLIEAMACGLPPVSFACPCGPREIIRDGHTGLLAENGNITQLADKICYLIEHPQIRKQMGQAARQDVQRFQIQHIGRQWEKLFDSCQ